VINGYANVGPDESVQYLDDEPALEWERWQSMNDLLAYLSALSSYLPAILVTLGVATRTRAEMKSTSCM